MNNTVDKKEEEKATTNGAKAEKATTNGAKVTRAEKAKDSRGTTTRTSHQASNT